MNPIKQDQPSQQLAPEINPTDNEHNSLMRKASAILLSGALLIGEDPTLRDQNMGIPTNEVATTQAAPETNRLANQKITIADKTVTLVFPGDKGDVIRSESSHALTYKPRSISPTANPALAIPTRLATPEATKAVTPEKIADAPTPTPSESPTPEVKKPTPTQSAPETAKPVIKKPMPVATPKPFVSPEATPSAAPTETAPAVCESETSLSEPITEETVQSDEAYPENPYEDPLEVKNADSILLENKFTYSDPSNTDSYVLEQNHDVEVTEPAVNSETLAPVVSQEEIEKDTDFCLPDDPAEKFPIPSPETNPDAPISIGEPEAEIDMPIGDGGEQVPGTDPVDGGDEQDGDKNPLPDPIEESSELPPIDEDIELPPIDKPANPTPAPEQKGGGEVEAPKDEIDPPETETEESPEDAYKKEAFYKSATDQFFDPSIKKTTINGQLLRPIDPKNITSPYVGIRDLPVFISKTGEAIVFINDPSAPNGISSEYYKNLEDLFVFDIDQEPGISLSTLTNNLGFQDAEGKQFGTSNLLPNTLNLIPYHAALDSTGKLTFVPVEVSGGK